jgi:hypothetical protein
VVRRRDTHAPVSQAAPGGQLARHPASRESAHLRLRWKAPPTQVRPVDKSDDFSTASLPADWQQWLAGARSAAGLSRIVALHSRHRFIPD